MRATRASADRPSATRSGVSANRTGANPRSSSRSSGGAVRLRISLISARRLSRACGSDVIINGVSSSPPASWRTWMILLESRDVKFSVQYPNASGHEIELDGTVAILGRDPSCDLVLNDVKCSRRHAVVEAGPQGLAIRDTGSANGVFLNGKKVDRSALSEGDVFRLGDVLLTVLPEDMPGTLVMGPEELGKAPAPPPRPSATLQARNTETVPPRRLPIRVAPRVRPEPHPPLTLTGLAILWMITV